MFRLQEVRGTMRTLPADEAGVRVRQSHFKSSQFAHSVPITGFGGAS